MRGGAKFLRSVPFLGKDRKVGETITAEELSMLTDTSIQALVSQGIIEVEGMSGPSGGAGGMSAADLEALRNLGARFDAFRETTYKQFAEIQAKLDAALAGKTVKPKRKPRAAATTVE